MAIDNVESNDKVRRIISPLSYLVDVVLGVEGLRVAAQVRLSHLARSGHDDRHTESVLKDLIGLEGRVTILLREEMEQHPTWPWLEQVKGAGLENSAKVVGKIEGVTFSTALFSDLRAAGIVQTLQELKENWGRLQAAYPQMFQRRSSIYAFDTMSKLRRFEGIAPMDGRAEKRVKGEKLHYSSELRTMLWRMGKSLIMAEGKFYDYYIYKKDEYTDRFTKDGYAILPTPKSGWKCNSCGTRFEKKRDVVGCCDKPVPEKVLKEEAPGVIFLGHLDNMAKRKMMVMFSDMLWRYWRRALGLPCKPSYITGKEPPVRQHLPEDFIG